MDPANLRRVAELAATMMTVPRRGDRREKDGDRNHEDPGGYGDLDHGDAAL
jgi:hypothetical protein